MENKKLLRLVFGILFTVVLIVTTWVLTHSEFEITESGISWGNLTTLIPFIVIIVVTLSSIALGFASDNYKDAIKYGFIVLGCYFFAVTLLQLFTLPITYDGPFTIIAVVFGITVTYALSK